MASTPDLNPTQLVRYVLQVPAMTDTAGIAQVRQQLSALGLVIDRLDVGEGEVAVMQANGVGQDDIRKAVQAAGFAEVNITAQTG